MIDAYRKLMVLVCVIAVTAACAGGKEKKADKSRQPVAGRPRPLPAGRLSPPPTPERGAYLGAWINPSGPEQGRAANRPPDQVAAMRKTFGSLGLLHVYAPWAAPAPVAKLDAIADAGAVPVLDWACGSDRAISEGREDDRIRSYAEALRRFGRPVFLRYAWEMNIHSASRSSCADAEGPGGFVTAWKRVRKTFRDVGAANVAFVWCPEVARPDTWRAYYPGADAVDWIGVDGYIRQSDAAAAATAFTRVFGSFYAEFVGEDRPIMVAETGALPGAQAAFLSSLSVVLPTTYPQVKAVAYFDARGPRGNWSLDDQGLRTFGALAVNPYFSFRA